MNQTVYVKIPSNNIHLHRNEREMLNRSRPGPGAAKQAIERSLFEQVAGRPEVKTSPQFQRDYERFMATRPQPSRKEVELESRLFEQVAAIGPRRLLGGDSSHFPGKPGL